MVVGPVQDLSSLPSSLPAPPQKKRKRLMAEVGRSQSFKCYTRKNDLRARMIADKRAESAQSEVMCGYLQGKRLLSTIGDWDFNIFTLNKLTNGRALFHTTLQLFQEHNLIDIFKLDIVKLMRFISLVEEGYHSSNPYHNAVHAADVGQAMHCYLKENKLAKALSPLEKLSALVAAITHDLDHPGVNQAFLIATSNHLAGLYNNTSVLENHHWRSAIGLMHESGVFDHFDDSLWKTMEWHLKSMILATDITRQAEFLARLRNHLDQKNLKLDDIEHKNFIMQIALKCADISNPCRPWELSKRWSELVCDEFFKQGDCERQLNLPVTPLCDRMSTTVPKIQTGFMKYVVTPLFQEWYRFIPTSFSEMMLSNISTNHSNWERIDQEAEAQKKQKEPETLHEEEEEDEDVELDDSSGSSSHPITQTTVVVIEAEPTGVVCSEDEDEDDETEREEEEEDKENTEPCSDTDSLQDDEPESSDKVSDEPLVPLCLYRRHSLPPPLLSNLRGDSLSTPPRRDSFPRTPMGRRYSLPVSAMPNSNSFDKLVEKLSSLVECSPTNGTHFDYDLRPRVVSVSQSLDAKTLSNAALEASKQTSAHGLDPILVAHRQYTSEPHIAMLAQHYRLNHKNHNLAHLARNLSVAGLLPKLSVVTTATSTTVSHTSLPMLSSTSGRSSQTTAAPSNGRPVAPPVGGRGPRWSLGDTRCVSSDYHRSQRTVPNIPATQSVDAICLSGVDTAENHSKESSRHSISSNHSNAAGTMDTMVGDSYFITASMATTASSSSSKHLSGSSEEETPLLHDLHRYTKDTKGTSSGLHSTDNSHANDSFTH